MRILGIDPGYAIVGYGVLDYEKNKFYPIEYGAVTTDAHTDFQERIKDIYTEVDEIIKRTKPGACFGDRKTFLHHKPKNRNTGCPSRGCHSFGGGNERFACLRIHSVTG